MNKRIRKEIAILREAHKRYRWHWRGNESRWSHFMSEYRGARNRVMDFKDGMWWFLPF